MSVPECVARLRKRNMNPGDEDAANSVWMHASHGKHVRCTATRCIHANDSHWVRGPLFLGMSLGSALSAQGFALREQCLYQAQAGVGLRNDRLGDRLMFHLNFSLRLESDEACSVRAS